MRTNPVSEPLEWNEADDGVSLKVKVQPRASRTGVVGVESGLLKVALHAPPVEGEANAACIKLLADLFHISKSRVLIVAGAKSRQKTVKLLAVSSTQFQETLASVLSPQQ